MRTDILEYLQKEIYSRCKKPENRFGMGCYYHIRAVVKNGEILSKLSYDKCKIAIVQNCIRNHRGSVCCDKTSIEELCVTDADVISHFDSVPSLLYLAYVERNMSIEEGIEFVRGKLERSFHKLSEESKLFYKDKYYKVMEMLK